MIKPKKLIIYLINILDIIIAVTAIDDQQIIGYTDVFLNGNLSVCGRQECNLGNLITDALVYSRVNNFSEFSRINFEKEKKWIMGKVNESNIDHFPQERNVIGLFFAKSIGHSIGKESDINQKIPITLSDIKSLFNNKTRPVDMVIMSGKSLRLFLQSNVQSFDYRGLEPFDSFLQVSGMRVVYDVDNYLKISKILIKCRKCSKNVYTELDENDFFDVMMPSHCSDSYYSDDSIFDSERQSFLLTMCFGLNSSDLVEKYFNQSVSPINTKVEGRIIINGSIILKICNNLIILSFFIQIIQIK